MQDAYVVNYVFLPVLPAPVGADTTCDARKQHICCTCGANQADTIAVARMHAKQRVLAGWKHVEISNYAFFCGPSQPHHVGV